MSNSPIRWSLSSVLLTWAVVGLARGDDPAPVKLTAQEDHKRMLELLKITSLRKGADGKAPNYDESKANPYPKLPDPLVLKNGKPVTTAEMWVKERRPEIVEDFDKEIYGRVPKETPKVKWEVTDTKKQKVGDIEVVTKTLVGHVDNSSYPQIKVDIQLSLTTPADAKGPVPVIMEFGFSFGGGGGPPRAGSWQHQVLSKGWGYAILTPTSVQADTGGRTGPGNTYQGLTTGIIGLCNKGQPRKVDDWGALRAWAWGASRALDYFETDKAVDAKQVGIEGLSRYGKAAIVTMAYDERFAIGFIGSSGEGGVGKFHRRNWGEPVEERRRRLVQANITGWPATFIKNTPGALKMGRSAGGPLATGGALQSATGVHQCRHPGERRWLGRCQGDVPRRRRRRPRLQAPRQERYGDRRIPQGRDGAD